MSEPTLRNWVGVDQAAKQNERVAMVFVPCGWRLSRLRVENRLLQMQIEIAVRAAAVRENLPKRSRATPESMTSTSQNSLPSRTEAASGANPIDIGCAQHIS
jgi:hypothetical protein